MSDLAKSNNLAFGEDIKLLGKGHPEKFKTLIQNNLNQTQAVVLWCLDAWQVNASNPFSAFKESVDSQTYKDNQSEVFFDPKKIQDFSLSIPCKFDRLGSENA